MKKLGKLSFCRLFLVIGLVVAIGFCIQPALAQDLDEMFPIPEGVTPLGDEFDPDILYEMGVNDGAFGGRLQATWVPAPAFSLAHPGSYSTANDGSRYPVSGTGHFVGPIRLPSGAKLVFARLRGYDNSAAYEIGMTLFRSIIGHTSSVLGNCNNIQTSGQPGTFNITCTPNARILNRDNWYQAYVTTNTNAGLNHRLFGVQLIWQRQIRPGLSHPFTDIGSLPTEFQHSIAALAASGITTGTTATTYSPSQAVNRGQMAVFLARALGLHWDLEDGY